MKLFFRARFVRKETWKDIKDEEKLSDVFLIFLPTKIEVNPLPIRNNYSSKFYEIKMETKKLFTLEDIKEKFKTLGIEIVSISHIKREFTDEELKEVKKLVCFKEIFGSKGEIKKQ